MLSNRDLEQQDVADLAYLKSHRDKLSRMDRLFVERCEWDLPIGPHTRSVLHDILEATIRDLRDYYTHE